LAAEDRAARSIIRTTDLIKTYGEGKAAFQALKGVSIEISAGEFVAVMGPSGSGKSTLMNLIGCLDTPTSGHYALADRAVEAMTQDELADIRSDEIGFVFQQFNLLPRTSALENVMMPLSYAHRKRDNARDWCEGLLRSVGLAERVASLPNEMSGGEQQRVAIARALVNDPGILLADEPTGALDSKSGDEIMSIFTRLNKEGRTIVMITHERYIAEYAGRIIHLKDGRIESDERNGDRQMEKTK
jgi:putative ABC transport system ATP-binding protein